MALQPDAIQASLGDMVRDAVVTAARDLSQLEAAEPKLWERHDWRNTCDALAEAICSGVRRFDIVQFLR